MAETTAVTRQTTRRRMRLRHVGRRWRRAALYVLPVLWSLFTAFCIVWLVLSSFKTNRELFTDVWGLPNQLQYENYVNAWTRARLGRQFLNSVVVVSVSVALLLAVSAPASYVLTRMRFTGSSLVTILFIAGAGIPLPLLFVPLFKLMANLGLINTLPGLMIVYAAVSLPFTIYLLTGFFRALPIELEDAARIDGCSEFNVFRHVMLPLASPGLATAGIFNFIALWNEYALAMLLIDRPNKMPISRGLLGIAESMQYTGDWVGLFAGVVIVMTPTALLYVFLSEQIIEGITVGAIK